MGKVRLELGAELDMLTKGELDESLKRSSDNSWERQAAHGLRHHDIPVMFGAVTGGNITLGAGQTDGVYCGPESGFYWSVSRVSVNGLATGDQVKLFKGDPSAGRFVTWIAYQPGVYSPGKLGLILKPGDFLSITGTGLTGTNIRVTGEAVAVPGPLMWKILT